MKTISTSLKALAAILFLTYLVYLPGLGAGFLFDDFVNLDAIGASGPVDDWPTFFRYITSGTADPIGRPLALLSFLIDARDWPADARSFLHTNLILHLLNGVLLFFLLRIIESRLGGAAKGQAVAVLGAGLWLLHPLMVSTTLYAVQREAMLPATFILAGLICYAHGRRTYIATRPGRGIAWMAVGILGGTALATLSKANGILLPLLAWILESTVLRNQSHTEPADRRLSSLRWILLVVPSLGLAAYLGSFLSGFNDVIPHRGWSVSQRLLTEARVITDYLQLLFVPRSLSTGLYNDAYVVSTGFLEPAATLPSLLAVVLIPTTAWLMRHRAPRWTAAVLFYFGAHVLESTVIPLELYFEHRNYLPAMLLFWPIASALFHWPRPLWLRAGLAACLLALFALITFQRATLWGTPMLQAALWAEQNPSSSRAQATLAMLDTSSGNPRRAMGRLGIAWRKRPDDLQLGFNYVNSSCEAGDLSADDANALEGAVRRTEIGLPLIHDWLTDALDKAALAECPGLTLPVTERWISAAAANRHFADASTTAQEIEPLRARLALHRKQPLIALRHFNVALAAFTTPDVAARQASTLARHGYYREALAHLDEFDRMAGKVRQPARGMAQLHSMVLEWQGYWPREMAILRGKLRAEIDAQTAGGASP